MNVSFTLCSIHIWDPFVGSGVHQIEGSTNSRLGGPVSVMTALTPFSQNLILAATPHDGLLHMVECRVGQVVIDLKICLGKVSLICQEVRKCFEIIHFI